MGPALLLLATAAALPASWQHFLSYRQQIVTASVEVYDDDREVPPGFTARPLYHTLRVAGADRIKVNRGDDAGVVIRTARRAPSVTAPVHYLSSDRIWMNYDGAPYVDASPQGYPTTIGDVRTLGAAGVDMYRDIASAFSDVEPETIWREVADGPLVRVTCTEPARERVWWLDPQREWSVVRSTLSFGGNPPHAESRTALRQWDGYWYPERVEYYRADHKDGKEPVRVVSVLAFEMNAPDQRAWFTPADIGVADGAAVVIRDRDTDAATWTQYRAGALVPTGARWPPAPQPAAPPSAASAAPAGTQPVRAVADFAAAWERYVREFTAQHKLNGEQCDKAYEVLRDCQEAARDHLARNRLRIDQLERTLAALPAAEEIRRRNVADMLGRLLAPIDRIFTHRLQPRVQAIPTRAQRAAATQPAR